MEDEGSSILPTATAATTTTNRASLKTRSHFNNLASWKHQDIVSSEVKKIKESSADDCLNFPTSALEANDVLWEYDGLHDAYEGECEEILLEMQRIFCEDLKAEPVRKGKFGFGVGSSSRSTCRTY